MELFDSGFGVFFLLKVHKSVISFYRMLHNGTIFLEGFLKVVLCAGVGDVPHK